MNLAATDSTKPPKHPMVKSQFSVSAQPSDWFVARGILASGPFFRYVDSLSFCERDEFLVSFKIYLGDQSFRYCRIFSEVFADLISSEVFDPPMVGLVSSLFGYLETVRTFVCTGLKVDWVGPPVDELLYKLTLFRLAGSIYLSEVEIEPTPSLEELSDDDFVLPLAAQIVVPAFDFSGVDWESRRTSRLCRKRARRNAFVVYQFRDLQEKRIRRQFWRQNRCASRYAAAATFWEVEDDFGAICADVVFELQSGCPSEAFLRRKERDAKQRDAAKAYKEAKRKAKPKDSRESEVKAQRDKRNPAFQSGKALPAAAIFGAGVLVTKLFGLLNKADATVSAANTMMKTFQKFAADLKKHLGSYIWYIPLVMTVFFTVRHFTGASSIVLSLMIAALAKVLGTSIWTTISDFFPEGNGSTIEPQSGGISGLIDVAPKLLATMFTFSVLKNRRPNATTEFVKRMSMLDRCSLGWDSFLKWMLSSLEVCINYVRRLFGKDNIALYKDAHGPTKDWMRRVDAACLRDLTGSDLSKEVLDEMVQLIVVGYTYREVYRGQPLSRQVDDYLVRITNAFMPYQGSLNSRNNFRFEPACVMLHGKPGVGKTLMAMTFCSAVMLEADLLPKVASFDDVAGEIWQKGISEFWNGYAGQSCLVMDDAFQKRADATDPENDYMSIIRMVSSWAFPLNFADLASKGKIYFSSKLVFGTTNLASIDSEARIVIQCPEAVLRRITFPYSVRVRREYIVGGSSEALDYQKFLAECERCAEAERPLDRFPWHMWEAATHDFRTGETSTSWVPMRDVIVRVAADLKKRGSSHIGSRERNVDFVGGYLEKKAADEIIVPAVGPTVLQAGKRLCDEVAGVPVSTEGLPIEIAELIERIMAKGSYAEILGVPIDASQKDIKKAYQYLSHAIGPGRVGDHKARFMAVERLNMVYSEVIAAHVEREEADKTMLESVRDMCSMAVLVKAALGVLLVGLCIRLVFIALRSVLSVIWDCLRNIFGGSRHKKKKKNELQSNRPETKLARKVGPRDVIFQGVDTTVATNVYANTYKMHVVLSTGCPVVIGQVQFLMANLAVQPEHFTDMFNRMLERREITPDTKVFLRNAGNAEHVLTFTVKHYLSLQRFCIKDTDVEFVNFGVVRGHRNIVSNYMREADIKHLSGYRGRLDVCEIDQVKRIVERNERRIYIAERMAYGTDIQADTKTIKRYFEYAAPTSVGDCGAPLCIFDNSTFSGRTCIGMHVAGNTQHTRGFSTIVTQEMILEAVKVLTIVQDSFEKDLGDRGIGFQSGCTLPYTVAGSFLPLGTVERPVVICPKTSYYPTSLFGVFGEYDYLPAHLSPVFKDGVKIYPMEQAVLPYSSPLLIYEQDWLKQACHTAFRPLSALTRDFPRRLYTFDEAVLGVPQEKFRSIPRGTAAGFPYVYEVRNGKKEFFGDGEVYDLTGPLALQLRERVDYILDCAAKNERLAHVFLDFLKDELRPSHKVEAVATRLISSSPLDYTIAWRMMFGAFNSAVMRVHTVSGMAPGICTFTDWDLVVKQLRKKGRLCFDGDFKAFDSSEQPGVHEFFLDYINRWYDDGERNATIRRVLWLDLVHSRHIGGLGADQRHIYQWNKSLPSGHPFTTIVNSMYSLFLLVSAHISLTGSLTGFWDDVSSVVYGDDNVSNVSELVSEIYNQRTVATALLSEFGVRYTPGDKSTDYQTVFPMEKLTFLKRGFVLKGHRWVCPLELDSFLYTCYWCKNRKLEEKIILDVLENALEELSMHDEHAWSLYAPKIDAIMTSRDHVSNVVLEQSQYQNLVFTRSDNWY